MKETLRRSFETGPRPRRTTALRIAVLGAAVVVLGTACSSLQEGPDQGGSSSAERAYNAAAATLASGDYEMAIQRLEQVESQYPFSIYAQQAQLDLAYANYKNQDAEAAIAAADRFIRLYPGHEHVDYAYYLRGLARYEDAMKSSMLFFKLDPSKRDPQGAQEAFRYFDELLRRFPESRYAEDAADRMVQLRNLLARHELFVARYYMNRGAYIAAANRAKYILEHYQRSPTIPEALSLLAEAYDRLGLPVLSEDVRRVLELNPPPDTGAVVRSQPQS